MKIAIKSEVDSRVFTYPLLKCLYNFGTLCLFTNNMQCSRLIEGDLEGGFKNIRIIIVTDGDLQSAMEADECFEGKYDYIIFDNVGAIDYDIMIALVTNHVSENYINDLLNIIDEPKTHIVKFGSPSPSSKAKKDKKSKEEIEGEDNENFNKWKIVEREEDILREKLNSKVSKWCKFPSWEAVEDMESKHLLITPDDSVINEIYRLLKNALNVEDRMFKKGARSKDESSSDISGADIG